MDYAGSVIKQNGKYLLQLRDNKRNLPNSNKWGTFGGGIKPSETPLEAIKRELKEELNLEKINTKLFFKISLKGKRYFIYKINITNQKLKLMEGQKIGKFSYLQIPFKKKLLFHVRIFFLIYPVLYFFNRR